MHKGDRLRSPADLAVLRADFGLELLVQTRKLARQLKQLVGQRTEVRVNRVEEHLQRGQPHFGDAVFGVLGQLQCERSIGLDRFASPEQREPLAGAGNGPL